MFDDNLQSYLATAEPIARKLSVQIVANGDVMARLYGDDAKTLQDRAQGFVKKINLIAAQVLDVR